LDTHLDASLSHNDPDDRLINSREVRTLCGGVSNTTIDRWLKGEKRKGRGRRTAPLSDFPKPIKIGNRNYWQLSDVRRFITQRKGEGLR
jgi:predicted DNA-binding transcriptional regulator AlpA